MEHDEEAAKGVVEALGRAATGCVMSHKLQLSHIDGMGICAIAAENITTDEVLMRLPPSAFLKFFLDESANNPSACTSLEMDSVSYTQALLGELMHVIQSKPNGLDLSPWVCSVICLMRILYGNQVWKTHDPGIASYIEYLPTEVSTPDHFSSMERCLFRGTTVAATSDWQGKLLHKVFETCVEPFIRLFPEQFPLDNCGYNSFNHCAGLISSRCFHIDGNGPYMLPIIDFVNHNLHPNCDVSCLLPPKHAQATSSANPPSNLCWFALIATKEIHKGEQLFVTYGKELSNTQLLQKYGFVVFDNNLNDTVLVTEADIIQSLSTQRITSEEVNSRIRFLHNIGALQQGAIVLTKSDLLPPALVTCALVLTSKNSKSFRRLLGSSPTTQLLSYTQLRHQPRTESAAKGVLRAILRLTQFRLSRYFPPNTNSIKKQQAMAMSPTTPPVYRAASWISATEKRMLCELQLLVASELDTIGS
ncbi:hypothetical protein Pelo_15512 [Pelomyxa schiedti]|nr:hypothetical protein Pelo_15512 [Pelomyxa schiedti]